MATVGSGDVLAGLVAGLRAQGLRSEQASFAGTYLHGRAGDLARDILGERSLLAGDLLQYLPVAMQECSR
jgi:NAD(P)H-hydrate epimerase